MSTASQVYLETMLRTATPQRLRLMVIGAALRNLDRTRDDWQTGRIDAGAESLVRVRDCLAELLAGVRPEASELAQRVQSLYLWMIERASELGQSRDLAALDELAEVLKEEQATWLEVCQQASPAPAATPTVSSIDPPRTAVPAPLAGSPRRSTMSFEA